PALRVHGLRHPDLHRARRGGAGPRRRPRPGRGAAAPRTTRTPEGKLMGTPLADDPRLAKIYEADAALTAPGMPYEVVEDDVLGERMPVFAHRHANLRDQLLAGAARYGDGDLYVWSDGRRQTFSGLVPEVAEVAAGLRAH